jgi:hypothetical protein
VARLLVRRCVAEALRRCCCYSVVAALLMLHVVTLLVLPQRYCCYNGAVAEIFVF